MKSVNLGYGAVALEPNGAQSDDIWRFNEAALRRNGVGEADIERYRDLIGGLVAVEPLPATSEVRAKGQSPTD